MKKLFILILVPFIMSCTDTSLKGELAKSFNSFYEGNHTLRKFSSQEMKTASSASASYFLFWGSADYKGEGKTTVIAFSWQSKNGEYILSKIPMNKVRVKFDNQNKPPYVTFSIDKYAYMSYDLADESVDYTLQYKLNYVIIHCKESDYPTDVNINDIN